MRTRVCVRRHRCRGLLIVFVTALSLGRVISRTVVRQVRAIQELMNKRRHVKFDASRGRDKTAEMLRSVIVVHDGLAEGQKLRHEQVATEETGARHRYELDQMVGVIRVIFQRLSRPSLDMSASAGSATESSATTVDQIEKLHAELEHRLWQATRAPCSQSSSRIPGP